MAVAAAMRLAAAAVALAATAAAGAPRGRALAQIPLGDLPTCNAALLAGGDDCCHPDDGPLCVSRGEGEGVAGAVGRPPCARAATRPHPLSPGGCMACDRGPGVAAAFRCAPILWPGCAGYRALSAAAAPAPAAAAPAPVAAAPAPALSPAPTPSQPPAAAPAPGLAAPPPSRRPRRAAVAAAAGAAAGVAATVVALAATVAVARRRGYRPFGGPRPPPHSTSAAPLAPTPLPTSADSTPRDVDWGGWRRGSASEEGWDGGESGGEGGGEDGGAHAASRALPPPPGNPFA